MGRPIQKRKIGLGSAKIEVTSAYFTGDGGVTTGDIANPLYIDRQRGSLQFLVKDKNGTKSEKLKLVGKANPAAGEMSIRVAIDVTIDGDASSDSTYYYVTKLHNRTVSCQSDNDPTTMVHLPYQLSTGGDDLVYQDLTLANIDVQK
jgi:hypothetical protein